ncbi:MAG: hypothetical protein KBD78_09045 [Oligoflexales bacterium]|nr:hypothetical protein [Oligoflexales bacterium]
MKLDDKQLYYYFSGQEQDRIDAGEFSYKAAQLLKLRDRLYILPKERFEAAIDTIEKVCLTPDPQSKNSNTRDAYSHATKLHDATTKVISGS